jgi:dienelactone hydrolase
MTIDARLLTLEQDGIPGYAARPAGPGQRPGILMVHHAHGVTADYKIDAYRLAQLGFNVLAPSLFNMFGVPGTNQIGHGADLQAKHSDGESLGKMTEAWQYLVERMGSDPARTAAIGHCMGGRLLIPFAADNPKLKAIVLYYPSVRDEPERRTGPSRVPPREDAQVRLAGVPAAAGLHRDAGDPGSALGELRRERPAGRVALFFGRQSRLPPPRQRRLSAPLCRSRLADRDRLPPAQGVIAGTR